MASPFDDLKLNGVFALGVADVEKLLKEVGVAADKDSLKVMMEKLQGKSIPQLIALGHTKFASMPAGGSGGASAPAAGKPAAAAKVEEKAPVKEEEADVDMGDLFGGGDY